MPAHMLLILILVVGPILIDVRLIWGVLAVQIKCGIEQEKDIFSVYVENISGGECHLDLHDAVSMETFVEGKPRTMQ